MNMEIDKETAYKRFLSRTTRADGINIAGYICFVLAVAIIVACVAIGGYNPK